MSSTETAHATSSFGFMTWYSCIILCWQVSTFGLSEGEWGNFFWPELLLSVCPFSLIEGCPINQVQWPLKLGRWSNGDFCKFESVRGPSPGSPVDPFFAQSTTPWPHPGVPPIQIGFTTCVKPPATCNLLSESDEMMKNWLSFPFR